MSEGRSRCSLGDLFQIENGFAFKSADFQAAGVPVIKIKNIKANHFAEGEHSFVSSRFTKERPTKVARRGDLLISMSGNRHDGSPETWVGKVAPFNQVRTFLINQRVGALRPKAQAALSTKYFGYLLSSWSFQEHFIAVATSSGGQANLSPKQILAVPVEFPPLIEQTAIAATLGALDDKIELNRRMNETLEAMARALFRDWFVDFGPTRAKMAGTAPYLSPDLWPLFPDRLDDEGKPEGWEVGTAGDVIELLDHKRIPLSARERANRKGPFPYHGATSVMDYVDDYLFDETLLLLGEDGSVAKVDGRPFTQYVWGKLWVNNHAHVIKGRQMSVEQLKCFFDQVDIRPYVTGAVQAKLNQANLRRVPLIHATKAIHTAFDEEISPLFEMIRHNHEESRTLAQTRDLLLPRLMSGELRVADLSELETA